MYVVQKQKKKKKKCSKNKQRGDLFHSCNESLQATCAPTPNDVLWSFETNQTQLDLLFDV
jgi:hypothetical protein